MTQKTINKYFKKKLFEDTLSLFSTEDDNILLSYKEAVMYSTTRKLDIHAIKEWFRPSDNTD